VQILLVEDAKIFKFCIEESTAPIPEISGEKRANLLEHFNCPASDPQTQKYTS
jgi:hypothetical protein